MPDQSYIIGATVHCEVRIATPVSGAPVNPVTVSFNQLVLLPSTVIDTPSGLVMTHVSEGLWHFDIPTDDLVPGTYRASFFLSNGTPASTAISYTSFVVAAS